MISFRNTPSLVLASTATLGGIKDGKEKIKVEESATKSKDKNINAQSGGADAGGTRGQFPVGI